MANVELFEALVKLKETITEFDMEGSYPWWYEERVIEEAESLTLILCRFSGEQEEEEKVN